MHKPVYMRQAWGSLMLTFVEKPWLDDVFIGAPSLPAYVVSNAFNRFCHIMRERHVGPDGRTLVLKEKGWVTLDLWGKIWDKVKISRDSMGVFNSMVLPALAHLKRPSEDMDNAGRAGGEKGGDEKRGTGQEYAGAQKQELCVMNVMRELGVKDSTGRSVACAFKSCKWSHVLSNFTKDEALERVKGVQTFVLSDTATRLEAIKRVGMATCWK